MHVSSGQFKADVLQGRDSVRAREHECMHRTDRPPASMLRRISPATPRNQQKEQTSRQQAEDKCKT